MKIIVHTSGSTGKQKCVEHDEEEFYKPASFLCEKWNLSSNDVIVNFFPPWTIAFWSFCYFPAKVSSCSLININFNPYKFWNVIDEIKPTILTFAIGTLRTLFKIKIPNLEYVRNFSTGSSRVYDDDLNNIRKTKALNIWNIYGSTEFIPPVLMSENISFFDMKSPYNVKIVDEKIIVNNKDTHDILKKHEIMERPDINITWKS